MVATAKLNLRELLSQLASFDNSGCLEVSDQLVSWKIYLQQGELVYVYCSAQTLDQLKYYFYRLGWKQAITALKQLPSSYLKIQSHIQNKVSTQNLYSKIISWLLAGQHIKSSQALKLIEYMTKDGLQFCLLVDKGNVSWHDKEPLPLWIREQLVQPLHLNLLECLKVEQTRLKQWQSCSEQILSVHQRPYFTPGWEQKTLPVSGSLNQQTLEDLTKILRGRTTIRQLSVLLKKDELKIARILSPYIDHKIIYLRDAESPLDRLPNIPRIHKNTRQSFNPTISNTTQHQEENSNYPINKVWKIICIDDSTTILKEIFRFLDQEKFAVTAITDPVKAVPIIFRSEPDLILLDITMPKINGYKLCSLLRDSDNCNQTPIIMVSGNTGFIDKTRAKLVGATDYLTKPFTQEELTAIIEKYLK
ncbi:Response regulator containing a CheY-like receiver domain and a GGDEF domain [Hyella patelloides LEGE 07179]|uniref:Response regulator containing a CheY-like receiver domain and a GGDEF domain n=1 Tax=Hyella patelloides LEGE 07179 TaxID=945734 RepID=A0A563VU74_9CYAN|nr:response regulator [Hyella patelloides]VEP14958.1 Response regulator containing a CheY-like receiver domain and a GGDEF domain [Hyella patelloides LEGE 07179]